MKLSWVTLRNPPPSSRIDGSPFRESVVIQTSRNHKKFRVTMPTLLPDIKGLLGDLWDNDGEQLPLFLWPRWHSRNFPPFNCHHPCSVEASLRRFTIHRHRDQQRVTSLWRRKIVQRSAAIGLPRICGRYFRGLNV